MPSGFLDKEGWNLMVEALEKTNLELIRLKYVNKFYETQIKHCVQEAIGPNLVLNRQVRRS